MILVKLAAALLCFQGHCYPALVGRTTPEGIYTLHKVPISRPGYGGDVLAFAQDKSGLFAIHRVYLLNPKQHRQQRLESTDPREHVITNGCINIAPEVYERLKDCCSTDQVQIVK